MSDKNHPTRALLAFALLFLTPAVAPAFRLEQQTDGAGTYFQSNPVPPGSGTTIRWIPRRINFQVNEAGAGDGLTFQQTHDAVAAAFDAYRDVSCATLSFFSTGATEEALNTGDGRNTLYWAEDGAFEFNPFFPLLGPGARAITILTLRDDQTLVDADIAFNGRDYDWRIGTTDPDERDVQDVATHEIGHLLGLHHTEVTSAPVPTMAPGGTGTGRRTLEGDDMNGICYLYPNMGGGSSRVAGDFDGNGSDDLAIGAAGESINGQRAAGAVNVIYSTSQGLHATGDQLWYQNFANVVGTSEALDHFGAALAAGDFDGDDFDDLAIGVRNESLGTLAVRAGAVNVLYGSLAGLTDQDNQFWTQTVPFIQDAAEDHDQFGAALATGDFNNDGYDDLAVGVPNEAVGIHAGAGAVNVIYGSEDGLDAAGNQIWHQDSPGIQGLAETRDEFGTSLTAGDFNGDGTDDLAIGVRNEGQPGIPRAGAVNVLYGSKHGLTEVGDQMWHQNTAGVVALAEAGDRFGSQLTAGDFDNDGYDDLAVGVPGEGIGSIAEAGAVNVLFGSASGLTAAGSQFWNQNTVDVRGIAEAGDHFGSALTAGDLNRDYFDDLVIGTPFDSVGNILGAGVINVLLGASSGPRIPDNQIWFQDSPGIRGISEADDQFGAALVYLRFNSRGDVAVAIGVPNDSVGSIDEAGVVNVIRGETGDGLGPAGDQLWHQNSNPEGIAIEGASESDDRLGGSL